MSKGAGGSSRGGGGYAIAATAAEAFFNADADRLERIENYTGSGYYEMNQAILGGYTANAEKLGPEITKELFQNASALQRDLRAAPKFTATTYRNMQMSKADIDRMVSSGQFVAKNPWSTSMSGSVFHGNVKFTLESATGVPVSRVSGLAKERELLLPAGTRFRVLSHQVDGDIHHITLKEIPRAN